MSDSPSGPGHIGWVDLTVPNARDVADFYETVVGWKPRGVDCGGYDDFNMHPPQSDAPVAGVCHARAGNKDLPTGWLIYIVVPDIDTAVEACLSSGGQVLKRVGEGDGSTAFLRDPTGAAFAIYQK